MKIHGRETSYITKYPKGYLANFSESEPCQNHEKVIIFFKCEGTLKMIEEWTPAIAFLDRQQKPYDVVYTNFVGTIVYKDDWQLLRGLRMEKWFKV